MLSLTRGRQARCSHCRGCCCLFLLSQSCKKFVESSKVVPCFHCVYADASSTYVMSFRVARTSQPDHPPTGVLCPKGHDMMKFEGEIPDNYGGIDVVCDMCRHNPLQELSHYFHCTECDYDICPMCSNTGEVCTRCSMSPLAFCFVLFCV